MFGAFKSDADTRRERSSKRALVPFELVPVTSEEIRFSFLVLIKIHFKFYYLQMYQYNNHLYEARTSRLWAVVMSTTSMITTIEAH